MSVGTALEKIVVASAKGAADLQIGVNKILWGSGNTQPVASAKFDPVSGSLQTTVQRPQGTQPVAASPNQSRLYSTIKVQPGLYGILDALAEADLCNIISYLTDSVNVKKNPRPEKPWTASQTAFYTLQDQAGLVRVAIDKYTAFPNTYIGSYAGTGADPLTAQQVISSSGLPAGQDTISGLNIQKYNIYNLTKAIIDIFNVNIQTPTGSVFTPEEKALSQEVLGLASNLNIVKDSIGLFNQFTDYRQINNEQLIKLQNKVTTLRTVCVTVENLDFKNALALAGNFLGVDIRSQIQQLSKFIDPTKIIPTLKRINNSIRSFIRIARKVQSIVRTSQFIIKIAILIIKVFKFVQAFLLANPLPNLFTTVGVQNAFSKAREAAQNTSNELVKILKEVNALLSVVLLLVRYLLANANELLVKLEIILRNLETCQAVKDSDVLAELKQTLEDLKSLRNDLGDYIIQYDSKTNPDSAMFGGYDIRVIDEEITDRSIRNKRRRGIALDQTGFIVTQSDLTFATNTTVIIEEVKVKLISAGLVQPSLGTIDGSDLQTISESLNYLDSNDVLQEDLNLQTVENEDTPDNQDENRGTGLNAFINNLPGGKRLRKRVRAKLNQANERLAGKLTQEGINASSALNLGRSTASNVVGGAQEERNPRTVLGRRNT
jgi:hypothetical protein